MKKRRISIRYINRLEGILYVEDNKELVCDTTWIDGIRLLSYTIKKWKSPAEVLLSTEERLRVIKNIIIWCNKKEHPDLIIIVIKYHDEDRKQIENIKYDKDIKKINIKIEYI